MPQPKLTDNSIAQLVKDTQRILADPTGAPDPNFQLIDRENSDREALYDLWSKEPLITSPSQLADPGTFNKFEWLTSELIRTDDQEQAFKLSQLLDELLYKQNLNLRQRDFGLFTKYEKLLALCDYLSIISLNLNEIEILVKENTAWALSKGIIVKKKMGLVLRHYHDIMMDGAIAEKITNALLNSKEPLGEKPIILADGKNYQPSVSNWLQDYMQEALVTGDKQTGTYARFAYMKDGKNYKNLQAKERLVLEELFKIHDWLKYGDFLSVDESDFEEEEEEQGSTSSILKQPSLNTARDLRFFEKTQDLRPAEGEEKAKPPSLIPNPSDFSAAADTTDRLSLIKKSITPRPVVPAPFKIEFEEDRKNKGLKLGMTEDEADNKKTAQLRTVSGSQQVPERPALTSDKSIPDVKNLSSAVEVAGNPSSSPLSSDATGRSRTPETRMSKPVTAPAWARQDELYHKAKPPLPPKPVAPTTSSAFASTPPLAGGDKQVEIDWKLEELKKKAERNKNG